jgi:glycosyltransferase involved in cell wall biosynthesis
MTAASWEVVAIGLPGHKSCDPVWTSLAIDIEPNAVAEFEAVDKRMTVLLAGRLTPRRIVGALIHCTRAMVLAPVRLIVRRSGIVTRSARLRLQPAYADTAYWHANKHFSRIYQIARLHRVDMWLANDWTTLPIAARLADEQGVPFAYDTHELAVDEFAQSLKWRLLHRPLIKHAEAASIRRAAFVTCVSDGIADRLSQVHGLSQRPIVIHNTPHYQSHALRPTGDVIKVLYHGIVAPGRGLEACIRSVALWRREFSLTVRGPAPPTYLKSLQAIASELGISERVTFDPPVPMTELVKRAMEFDVGLSMLSRSHQHVYALPNKFFEYMMAGLALVVSDLPEMAQMVRQHDLGRLIGALAPQSIAAIINGLDRSDIDRYKANALLAAKVLNWQVEGVKFAELSAAAVARSRNVCSPGAQI